MLLLPVRSPSGDQNEKADLGLTAALYRGSGIRSSYAYRSRNYSAGREAIDLGLRKSEPDRTAGRSIRGEFRRRDGARSASRMDDLADWFELVVRDANLERQLRTQRTLYK